VWLKGRTLRCKEAARDMKAAIDEVTEKLHRELAELRDKRVAKRRAAPAESQP
jgi:ribosome-associated translation inhibitor RaiA